jgi:WD40 repeat protein
LIEVWDLAAGAVELRLVGHVGTVTSLVFHAQSSLLASGSFDTTARLWNLGTTPPVRQAAEPRLIR